MSDSGSELQVHSKIWLEVDGEPVFGKGEELLRLIQQYGSINAAAQMTGVPNCKVWAYVDAIEKRLGFPLVHRLDGPRRGKSSLTPQAEMLLKKFDLLQKSGNDMVNCKFIELDF